MILAWTTCLVSIIAHASFIRLVRAILQRLQCLTGARAAAFYQAFFGFVLFAHLCVVITVGYFLQQGIMLHRDRRILIMRYVAITCVALYTTMAIWNLWLVNRALYLARYRRS